MPCANPPSGITKWYAGRVGSLKIRSRTLRAFSAGALPTLDPVRDTHRLYARRCLTTPPYHLHKLERLQFEKVTGGNRTQEA
jgi:hypothetical protein